MPIPSPRVWVSTALAGAIVLVGLGELSVAHRLETRRPFRPRPPAREPAGPSHAAVEDRGEQPREPCRGDRGAILSMIRAHRVRADETSRRALADAIYHESVAAEVDPLMTASIIAAESSFRPRVVSSAGAVGLMQLRPFVAEDVARRRRVGWRGIETLHDPRANVRLGLLYFKELVRRFDGDTAIALTAYNRGPTRVRRQLRDGTYAGSSYARRILERYERTRNRLVAPRRPSASHFSG